MTEFVKIYHKTLNISDSAYLKPALILKKTGAEVRVVGGAVRDSLLGQKFSDIDLAVNLPPIEVMKILKLNNIHVVESGIKYGTITAIIDSKTIEITSLRQDISSDGRHASVSYGASFFQDAKRRDFTINALSYCPFEHKIYDYFHGTEDLQKGIVQFIGDPIDRIKEDHLRILRFFRFSAKFSLFLSNNFHISSLNACSDLAFTLEFLSKERLEGEMDLILNLENYIDILFAMHRHGILRYILPIFKNFSDYNITQLKKAEEIAQKIGSTLSLETKYAIIIQKQSDKIEKHASVFQLAKFSKKKTENIMTICSILQNDLPLDYVLKDIWYKKHDLYQQCFIVAGAYFSENTSMIFNLHQKLATAERIKMPLQAKDLQKMGFAGKDIGINLKKYYIEWVTRDFGDFDPNFIQNTKNDAKK